MTINRSHARRSCMENLNGSKKIGGGRGRGEERQREGEGRGEVRESESTSGTEGRGRVGGEKGEKRGYSKNRAGRGSPKKVTAGRTVFPQCAHLGT